MATSAMNIKRLFAVSFGHFSIDVINSSIPIILTAVTPRFDLTVSQIGLAAMIYTFAASLTQPLFGILNDRLRGRWVAAAGVAWTMAFYTLGILMPTYPAMVACLTLGALGSGAFHPAGMVNATMSGGNYPTTATSIFFVMGQVGLALGPLLAGFIAEDYGISTLAYLALAATPAVVAMFAFVSTPYEDDADEPAGHAHAHPHPHPQQAAGPARNAQVRTAATRGLYVAIAFILLIVFRSTTQQSFTTLLPKYFSDQGFTPSAYGTMVSILAFAGATGTFIGGWLGDRFNRRMVIFLSMSFGALFSFSLLHADGWLYAIAAIGAGIMMNIPHSILLIMAQRLLPKRKGMIGGAVLGLMFASGAAMAGLGSWIAEFVGLPMILSAFALLPLGGAACALFLPSTRGIEPAAPAPTKSAASAAD